MFHDQKVAVKTKYCLHLVCWDLVVGLKGSARQTPPGIESVNISNVFTPTKLLKIENKSTLTLTLTEFIYFLKLSALFAMAKSIKHLSTS